MSQRSLHDVPYILLIPASEPPPRGNTGQQQAQGPVPATNPTGSATGRGGGGNFRGNQMNQMSMVGNMRGGSMPMGGNMMRQGMMSGMGGGMGTGLGIGMGGFVGGGNAGFQSGGGGFGGGRGGGMIPQGPRGGMVGRGGGMMGSLGTNF